MELTTAEKIRLLLKRQNLTLGELAEKSNQTRQNLSNKMKRDNFTEKEIQKIAEAMNCKVEIIFITENGETI